MRATAEGRLETCGAFCQPFINHTPRLHQQRELGVGLTHVESPPLPVSLDRSKTKRKEGTAAMKDQAIHYLGLDVHQATIVATSRNESGAIVLKATVPTEAKAIVGLVRGQGPRVHVAFEEGTQAQWLHDLLQPVAERVVVCNVRGNKELVNKNDDIDSDLLSERLRLGALKGVYHGAASVLPLKEMVRNYGNLGEDATRVMQRIKANILARVRVAQIIAIVGTPNRFRGKRRFWPYIGLAVVTHSSADHEVVAGTIRRRRRAALTRGLNRNHNRVLKSVFKGAATAAAHKD